MPDIAVILAGLALVLLSVLLLSPFFLVSGSQVDLRGLDGQRLVQLIAIIAVAVVGKFASA